MGWGIVAVSVLGVFISFVILQETFAQRHWRGLVKHGDRWAIKTLVQQEIGRWQEMRVPKGMSPALWHGIQTADVAGVGRDFIHVIGSAEAEYRFAGGKREQVSSALDEGMKLDAALIERLFYDIPNVRVSLVRVDLFTTFRTEEGTPEQRCILSTVAERADADHLPWDDLLPHELVNRFESTYRTGPNGVALPIEPGPPLTDADGDDLTVEAGTATATANTTPPADENHARSA